MIRKEYMLTAIHGLQADDLDRWIGAALLTPDLAEGEAWFTQSDQVRVQLLQTLKYTLEIEEATLPVVVSLIDQLYETRARLRLLAGVVAGLEPAVRDGIMAAVTARTGSGPGPDASGV
ncbi:MAG: hypothetical protein H7245_17760 [Candidatus Saccharibacteria bacterium]|nr:hypothetical protein [Pseudorhodobacter sp.]